MLDIFLVESWRIELQS